MAKRSHADTLAQIWDAHVAAEFEARDADATVATMTDDATLIHMPTGTGGRGKEVLRAFYARHFIPAWPDDVTVEPITRTIGAGANGTGTIVDEMLIRCTHSRVMDFWLPGLAPTGLPIASATIAVVGFAEDLVAFERIYWDQASLLAQVGVLDTRTAPILGAEQGAFLTDPDAPLNELLEPKA
jgi:carboxymethylenebutenolidase